MSLMENFPHRVTRTAPTYTSGAYGGDMQVPTAMATDIEAWVQSATHAEVAEFAKREQTITHKVLLLPTDAAAMSVGERLVVTSGPSHVGLKFEIRSVGERTAGLNWMHTAMVELIHEGI